MRYSRVIVAAAWPLAACAAATAQLEGGAEFGSLLRSRDQRDLLKRDHCGEGIGPCPDGLCCSEMGYCGSTAEFCKSPQCQIPYSNGACDADQEPCGSGTENIPRNDAGDAPYGVIIRTCTQERTVALTFDDGPYIYTSALLDLLQQYDAKVTFFVAGNNLGKGQIDDPSTEWPAIIRRMRDEGHQIGSHTWSHPDLSQVPAETREQEMRKNEMALRNVLGFFPKYMRPPYGSCTAASGCLDQLTQLGYHIINWDVDTKDFENDSPDRIQRSKDLFDAGFDGSVSRIVLSHDTKEQTVYTLAEYMLESVLSKGFRAVTVGECLGDPEENWYTAADVDDECAIPDYGETPRSPEEPTEDPTVSKDGTCGERSDFKFTCEGSSYGDCCSYNGYCGSTSGYCDGGCQTDFGSCNTVHCGDPLIVSENGLCGGKTHQTCLGSSYGDCCSLHGNCGDTDEYCSVSEGCQADFGTCL